MEIESLYSTVNKQEVYPTTTHVYGLMHLNNIIMSNYLQIQLQKHTHMYTCTSK